MKTRSAIKCLLGILAFIILTPLVLFCVEIIKEVMFGSGYERREKREKELIIECKESALAHDFITAYKKFNELKEEAGGKKVSETYDFIFKEEAIYLCAKNDESSHRRLSFLLTSMPVEGKALPEGTLYYNSVWHEIDEHKVYRNYVISFNQKCNYIIDLAIANHKFNIVKYVYPLYKLVPDPLNDMKDKDNDSVKKKHMSYRISYSDFDREAARRKINEAIKLGVFPGITKLIE